MNREYEVDKLAHWEGVTRVTTPQEALDSIAERARRALRDNDEARLQIQQMAHEEDAPPPRTRLQAAQGQGQPLRAVREVEAAQPPAAKPAWGEHPDEGPERPADQVERRMRAINLVQELEPRRTCFRERVQELSQRLATTPSDSVHYASLLQRLAEAHAELVWLEERVEAAQHAIRSTEWLMEMLSDPFRRWERPARQERG